MPIEIRELIIKTTIHSHPPPGRGEELDEKRLEALKVEILQHCRELLQESARENSER